MTISLTEDFRTVEELQAAPAAILKQLRRTGRPVVITDKGKPSVVMLDASHYEKRLQTLNLARLIAEAEADVQAGRLRPVGEFFDELYREKKIPRRPNAKRRSGRARK